MAKVTPEPQILAHVKTDFGAAFQLRKDPPGPLDVPALENVLVSIHVGVPADMSCRRNGKQHRGKVVHGDIDIIPAQMPSHWEMHDENDMSLLLSLPTSFLEQVARDSGIDAGRVEILNRFQMRDNALENLSWVIKHEIEIGCPSGRLYLEGLALAFASRLLARHSSAQEKLESTRDCLQGNRLKRVLSLIEEEIATDLSLAQIAEVAGVSTTHLQTLFHNAMELSVRQYIIRRRVERAKALLLRDRMPLADIADAVGFSDQSHMARHMRRVLNITPRELRSRNRAIQLKP